MLPVPPDFEIIIRNIFKYLCQITSISNIYLSLKELIVLDEQLHLEPLIT